MAEAMPFPSVDYEGDLAATEEGTTTAAGDGGDDGELGVIGDRGVFFFGEVADVLVIDIHVDERPQLAVGCEEVSAQRWELLHQPLQTLGDGGTCGRHGLLPVSVGAQRCGDVNLHGSIITCLRKRGERPYKDEVKRSRASGT